MKRKSNAKPRAKARSKPHLKTKPRQARQKARPRQAGDPIDAMVAAGARALGIPLDPAWRASVAFNLRLILNHAAKVDSFVLPDDAEPAPIFHA